MGDDSKIAIIGAGTSGLAAGVALVERGVRNITVFEARKECGGRTRSYTDSTTGDVLDNGQHLLMGCYTCTLRYLHTIGSENLYHREPMRIYFHEPGKHAPSLIDMPDTSRPPTHLLRALRSSKLLTAREKISAVWLGLGMFSTSSNRWEGYSCSELFQKLRQPPELVRKLWGPIVVAVINAPVERASAVLFIRFFKEAFLSGKDASDFLIPTVGLSELLIDPALDYLQKNGSRICASAPVRSIERENDQFRIHTDSASEVFDSIIYSSQTADALPSDVQERLPKFEFSPIVNAYFWLDRTVFTAPIHAYLGTMLQWSFTRPSTYAAQRLALTVSAGNELAGKANEEVRAILWNDLCSSVPDMKGVNLLHYQIIKEKRATPLITPSIQAHRPNVRTHVRGLYLAGDIVQNELPGTIEGAVRNGYASADALIRDLS